MIFIFRLLQRHWQFEDLGKYEDEKIIESVDVAVADSFFISNTKKFKKANDKQLKKTMDQVIKDVRQEAKTYSGPASGKPKVPGIFGKYKLKQELSAQIRIAFVENVSGSNLALKYIVVDDADIFSLLLRRLEAPNQKFDQI
jgi:hypothetical protein